MEPEAKRLSGEELGALAERLAVCNDPEEQRVLREALVRGFMARK